VRLQAVEGDKRELRDSQCARGARRGGDVERGCDEGEGERVQEQLREERREVLGGEEENDEEGEEESDEEGEGIFYYLHFVSYREAMVVSVYAGFSTRVNS